MASFYFDKEAKRRINASVTAFDVVRILNLPTKKIGSRISILCPSPEHADTNYGSCSIDSRGNCYCYVCRKRFQPIDMMMDVGGYSLYEAVTILAEEAGLENEYLAKEQRNTNPMFLSREERELIGLTGFGCGYRIKGASTSKPMNGERYIVRGDEYLLVEYSNEGDHLRLLLESDPDSYRELVRSKIREKTEFIRAYAARFGKDDQEVREEYLETIQKLKLLAERFSS